MTHGVNVPPKIHPTIHPLLHQALMQPDGRSGPAVWPRQTVEEWAAQNWGVGTQTAFMMGKWAIRHIANQCHVLARVTVNWRFKKNIDIHIKEAVKTIEKGDWVDYADTHVHTLGRVWGHLQPLVIGSVHTHSLSRTQHTHTCNPDLKVVGALNPRLCPSALRDKSAEIGANTSAGMAQ